MKLSKTERAAFQKVGRRGGRARAKALTPTRRTEIARIAALARWAKPDAKKIA